MEFNHYSVLLNETIENLNIKPDGIYVDGTLGGGGHAYQVASRLSEKGRLIGIDQNIFCSQALSVIHSHIKWSILITVSKTTLRCI